MRTRRGWVAVAASLAIFASACGGDDDSSSTTRPASTDAAGSTTTAGSSAPDTGTPQSDSPTTDGSNTTPTPGGTLRYGLWAPTKSLDPISTAAIGTSGGIELMAIYDVLVAWDPVKKEYEYRTAESLTPNDDFTKWTLQLRPNIKFSDGTDYDAEAVVYSFGRQKENPNLAGVLAGIAEIKATGPLTVEFNLTSTWAGFPIVLNNTTGMIVSPKAAEALGKDGMGTQATGAGAGPFIVERFMAGESLTLKRNPNYWGGDVPLDGIEFKFLSGGPTTYESLKAGELDAAFLRDVQTIDRAKTDGAVNSFLASMSSGEMLLLNHGVSVTCKGGQPEWGCAGKADGEVVKTEPATASLTVRQAIQAAIDLSAVDQRVNGGKGLPSTSLLDADFPWNPGVEIPAANLDKAKELTAKAKSEGWDGTVRLTCGVESPERRNEVQVLQALLTQAGINIDMAAANVTVGEQVDAVIVKKDYEMACWGLQIAADDDSTRQIEQFLRTGSASNRGGYSNPDMDKALDALRSAGTDESRTAAWRSIAELWNQDVVSVPLFATPQGTFWGQKVHGIQPTGLASVILAKAWIQQ